MSNSSVTYADDASPDLRNYRVDCSKIARVLPAFQPVWTVRKGIEELYEAHQREKLVLDDFLSSRYMRIKHVGELKDSGRIDSDLRWRSEVRSGSTS